VNYEQARKKLVEHLNVWKPDGEIAEVLDKALQALNDCIEMGLNGEGD
jgi:hypothetical protein